MKIRRFSAPLPLRPFEPSEDVSNQTKKMKKQRRKIKHERDTKWRLKRDM